MRKFVLLTFLQLDEQRKSKYSGLFSWRERSLYWLFLNYLWKPVLSSFYIQKRQYWSSIVSLLWKRPITIFMVFVLCGMACADMTKDKALTEFTKANFAYRDGKYKEAIMHYEAIIDDGLESGPLYYNLANSFFKNSELGKAMLNYERAFWIMPRDSDLRANYKYALSQVKENVVYYREQSFLRKKAGKFLEKFTRIEMIFALYIAGVFIAIVHLFSLFFYSLGKYKTFQTAENSFPKNARSYDDRREEFSCWPISTLCILSVLFFIILAGYLSKSQVQGGAAIVLENVESKFEPREEATMHFELFEGSKVKILKKEGLWVKIRRLDRKEGWVLSSTVESI